MNPPKTKTAETTTEGADGIFDTPAAGMGMIEPPDFEKMKVVDLKAFASENTPAQAEALCKLKKAELIEALKQAYPHPDALDTPEVTGFDPVDRIHKTVGEVQALASEKDAVAYVYGLVDTNEFNFFKMGGALAEMLAKGWMGEYDDFGSFVEGTFGFKLRKAQNLISVYHAIVSCGATWEEVAGIGWSKLSLIATKLTTDNYKQWFEKISEATFATVQEMVKDAEENGDPGQSSDAGAESTPKKTLRFVVHEDQVETIMAALAKAKEAGSTEYDGQALEGICIEYLGSVATTTIEGEDPEVQPVEAAAAFSGMIKKLIASEEDPLDALVIAVEAFEAAFGEPYPNIDFDVYTDGKPGSDDLAEDDTPDSETEEAGGD